MCPTKSIYMVVVLVAVVIEAVSVVSEAVLVMVVSSAVQVTVAAPNIVEVVQVMVVDGKALLVLQDLRMESGKNEGLQPVMDRVMVMDG